MPPRHAYWTILVDNLPTAFRAANREDLLPTYERLRRKHPSAMLMWFARGRLWESPDAAMAAGRKPDERRNRDWRPGGEHRDPRERFRKERQERNAARRRERYEQRQQRTDRDVTPRREGEPPSGRDWPAGARGEGGRGQRRTPANREFRHRPDRQGWRPPQGPTVSPEGKRFERPGPRGQDRRRDTGPKTGWRPPAGDAGRRPPSKPAGQGYGDREARPPGRHDRKGPGGRQRWGDGRPREGTPRGAQKPTGPDRRPRTPSRPARPRATPVRERTHPAEPPPSPPPGPDRPPRPGEEPSPLPTRVDEIVTPTPPPERGRGRDAGQRPPGRRPRKP
jgi:hypothetical protein